MEIIGNQNILEHLRKIARNGQEAPSYLFSGPKGVGKFLTARWFCAAVLCTNPDIDDFSPPCGNCSACRRVKSGNHPDISILGNQSTRASKNSPGIRTKATKEIDENKDDKKAHKMSIGIEEVREGIAQMQTCSFEGGYRFWIIDEAQRLTNEAQNALLKTLEEPPASLILILIVQPGGQLLPTVTSRCRPLNFRPLNLKELSSYLQSQGFDHYKAETAAHISGGSLGLALNFLQNTQLWDRRTQLFELLNKLKGSSLWNALSTASSIEGLCSGATAKEQLAELIEMAASFYRDALCLKVGGPQDLLVNVDNLENLSKLAQESTITYLKNALESWQAAGNTYLPRNVNTKLYLQKICLDCC